MRLIRIKRLLPNIGCIVLTIALTLCATPQISCAETTETDADPDEFQTQIEKSSKEYEEASKKSAELNAQITEKQARVDELNEQIPEQEARASSAVRELYFLNSKMSTLLNWILGVEDLDTAIRSFDYIEHIHDSNFSELQKMSEMKAELDENLSSLDSQKKEADVAAAQAKTALEQAQAAREEAQRKAQEKAAAEAAEAERVAKEQQEKAAAEAAKNSTSSTIDNASPPKDDGANWSTDKETFVNEWAGRIDNYLSGSPLAGQGKTFASAAWDYGVDPRWSPAISNTESSKGLYCFKSHNAWGWGSSSWSSWEEAINAHVKGLAAGYGYTISISAAKKYCPPNWQHWYTSTSAQMNKI